jgi:hypothetical protein
MVSARRLGEVPTLAERLATLERVSPSRPS